MLQIQRRKWEWIGHTLRKPEGTTEIEVLDWNLQEARIRGCLEKNWERTVQEEYLTVGKNWNNVKTRLLTEKDRSILWIPCVPVGMTSPYQQYLCLHNKCTVEKFEI